MTTFDKDGKKVQTITHEKFSHPTGVTVDKDDNIFVASVLVLTSWFTYLIVVTNVCQCLRQVESL